jgi:hypothetical protein
MRSEGMRVEGEEYRENIEVRKVLQVRAIFRVEDDEEIPDLAGSIEATVCQGEKILEPNESGPLVEIASSTVPHSIEVKDIEGSQTITTISFEVDLSWYGGTISKLLGARIFTFWYASLKRSKKRSSLGMKKRSIRSPLRDLLASTNLTLSAGITRKMERMAMNRLSTIWKTRTFT